MSRDEFGLRDIDLSRILLAIVRSDLVAFLGPVIPAINTTPEAAVIGGPMSPVYLASRTDLGTPTNMPATVYNSLGRSGLSCQFESGAFLFWSGSTGTHRINGSGAIYAAWQAAGGVSGRLGFPVTDESPAAYGGFFLDFESGASIYWSKNTGAHIIQGAIRAAWLAMGGPSCGTGYTVSDETWCPPGCFFNLFKSGDAIYWSQQYGAHLLKAPVLDRWMQANGPSGPLGLPISDGQAVAGGFQSDFEHDSTVCWSPDHGARIIQGPILDMWRNLGGVEGAFGFPVSDEEPDGTCLGGGSLLQAFENGGISWTQAGGAVPTPLPVQEQQLLAHLGSNLLEAITQAYGQDLVGTGVAFLPWGLAVSDTLVQDGAVNPAQVMTWLGSMFDSPFLQTTTGPPMTARDDSHGTASQIYTIAVSSAKPVAPADDPAWARMAGEIASAERSMGVDMSSRTLSCTPLDWPLGSTAQAGYWTAFDRTAADDAGGGSTAGTAQNMLWMCEAPAVGSRQPSSVTVPQPSTLSDLERPGDAPFSMATASMSGAPPPNSGGTGKAVSFCIHLEHACVTLAYTLSGEPWWNEVFLTDAGWYVPGMRRGDLLPAPGGPVPCVYSLPQAFVLVRNATASCTWTARAQTPSVAAAAISVGPASPSGAVAAASADGVTVTFNRPGMQVVALFSTPLPVLPPSDQPSAPSTG